MKEHTENKSTCNEKGGLPVDRTHVDLFTGLSPASPSQPELTGCEPSPCARATPAANPSSQKHGRESRYGQTLERSTWPTPDASEAGKSSRGGKRVNEPLLGGLIRASGSLPLAFPASQPHGPGSNEAQAMTVGSGHRLLRSLLPSDPLGPFSRILLESEMWASPEFYLTWKHKATRQGCLVWELAPSAPRTVECDTGLFANEPQESAWPTPASRDVKGQTQNPERSDYIPNILKSNWPTPRSEDSESTGAHRGTPDTLTNAAAAWATPNKSAEEGGPCRPEGRIGHSVEAIDQLHGATASGCLARTERFVERLTTLSAWLLGYTAAYLAHWETASSGRSRRKSSKP